MEINDYLTCEHHSPDPVHALGLADPAWENREILSGVPEPPVLEQVGRPAIGLGFIPDPWEA